MASMNRRRALGALAGSVLLQGCCCNRPFPEPGIALGGGPMATEPAFLRAPARGRAAAPQPYCVDVHTHFFNASDVTVKGYIEGPMAHSMPGQLGNLLRALAPLAEALAELAPTAAKEYKDLDELVGQARVLNADAMEQTLAARVNSERITLSREFFRLISRPDGRDFVEKYNSIKSSTPRALRGAYPEINKLDETSVINAMRLGESLDARRPLKGALADDGSFYAEGVLAFIGYMLSSRWANLRSYQQAFSGPDSKLNVDCALSSLVDFDRWLDCPPRSAHEDQMRLHARLSKLSAGYMKPLISYNPWTDVVNGGAALRLVNQAVTEFGFVGVKIYPPNGFRPWGNTAEQDGFGLPSHRAINDALEKFWDLCIKLDVPVMAHTNHSMGKDQKHDELGGPQGWAKLAEKYEAKAPRVNLGHFGGSKGAWNAQMANIMSSSSGGARMYGDLGFWTELRCGEGSVEDCTLAAENLRPVSYTHLTLPTIYSV